MNIQIIDINKLIPATYNPRKDLKPDDAEYIKIKNSIVKFGFVSPLVINKDMTVIGGHQRLKVLKEFGKTEVECIVVDLDKTNEKALNIALNKIQGDWDEDKLEALLQELKLEEFDMNLTGFDFDEVDEILNDIIEKLPNIKNKKIELLNYIEKTYIKSGLDYPTYRDNLIKYYILNNKIQLIEKMKTNEKVFKELKE